MKIANISTNFEIATVTNNFQDHLTQLQDWYNLWKIQINKNKSTHITFTLRPVLTLMHVTVIIENCIHN